MFHVFYYTDNGVTILDSRHYDEDEAIFAVEALSERKPHAFCDYVYKDV